MALNPDSQYADDRNLRARQELWSHQRPRFDIVAWVLGLADVQVGDRVLDVGCGNGTYLQQLSSTGVHAIGCDLSVGMLGTVAGGLPLVNADVVALPFLDDAFDVVLAPHMLYHVADRGSAVGELRRVLRPGGRCVVVTNGAGHMRALRRIVESAVREATPGWEMRNPSTHEFSLENGERQLRTAFASVECTRPVGVAPASVRDAGVAAAYVESVADHYEAEVDRPWTDVVDAVRREVGAVISSDGAFDVAGDPGAFICR